MGGDFSDVFLLDDWHVAILIGDVAGKGIRAAGLTETVRSTVRAFAAVDSSPASILRMTNQLLLRRDVGEELVTAFLVSLDTLSGRTTFASAAHPPPVHLSPSSCHLLELSFGVPLGSFDEDYLDTRLRLTPDDALVLYTDGVTEARRGRELFGYERLVGTVSALRGRSMEELAEGVRDAAVGFSGRLKDEHARSAHAIDVALHLERARLSVVVADWGCGLDIDSHEPHGKPALHRPKGRGLYLMASLIDEFAVHRNGGTEGRMVKRLA